MPLWLIFPLLAAGWLIQPLPRVDLEILDSHFVRIPVGNPQHTYTLILDLKSDGILISSSHPEFEIQSNSFDVAGGRRSDLFALGQYTLRLPYKFGLLNYDRTIQLSSQHVPIGSLGLGEHSPLWRYWRNFSLTNEKLRLGETDPFAGNDDTLPVLSGRKGYISNPDSGTYAPMIVDLGSMNLLLPHTLMDEKPNTLALRSCANPDHCPEEALFTLHSQDIFLLTGSSYTALDQSHDGLVHLGRRFFYDVRMFCDWSEDVLVLSNLDTPDNKFNPVYAYGLAILMWIWLFLRLGHRKIEQLDSTEYLLNALLELLVFEIAFAAWLTDFFIFNWSWALEELLDPIMGGLTGAFIHISLLSSLVLAGGLYFTAGRYHFEWHSLALFNATLSVLWSSFAQHHHIFADVGFLLLFSTSLALVNGVIFTLAILFHNKKLTIASGFATLLSYGFLCVCNLVPFHETLVVGQNIGLFVAEYLVLLLFIPSLFVSSHLLRGYIITQQPKSKKQTRSEEVDPSQLYYYATTNDS